MRRQRQRDRPLTAAEIEALRFIAKQHNVELVELLREHGLANQIEELTVRQVDRVLAAVEEDCNQRGGRMLVMIEEYHVTMRARQGLPDRQYVTMRRALNSRAFQQELRAAVLEIMKRRPQLAGVRVAISR